MSTLADPSFRAQIPDPVALVALVGHKLPPAHSAVLKAVTNPNGLTAEDRKILRGGLLSSGIAKTKIQTAFVAMVILVCGPRWGKSFASTLRLISDALLGDWWQHVLPGQRAMFAICDPDLRQAREETRAAVFWLDLL